MADLPEPSSVDEIVTRLGLAAHPEGGYYRETFRDADPDGRRGAFTAIYYLLPGGSPSAWHRILDAGEIWHHYAGAPLELEVAVDGTAGVALIRLDSAFEVGSAAAPQALVPAGAWQRARSLGAWSLVGCTVAPAFDFASFELAPPGWSPPA